MGGWVGWWVVGCHNVEMTRGPCHTSVVAPVDWFEECRYGVGIEDEDKEEEFEIQKRHHVFLIVW